MTEEQFAREYGADFPRLVSMARRWCKTTDRAEDLIQDAALKAWGKIHLFEPGTSLFGWVTRIARNIFIEQMRLKRNQDEWTMDDESWETVFQDLLAPDDQELRSEVVDAIKTIEDLPPHYAEVMFLLAMEYEPIEIAEKLGQRGAGSMNGRHSSHSGVATASSTRKIVFRSRQILQGAKLGPIQSADRDHGKARVDRLRLPTVQDLPGSRAVSGFTPDLMAAVQLPDYMAEASSAPAQKGCMMADVTVPEDETLVYYLGCAFRDTGEPIKGGWTEKVREKFWQYINYAYPDYHNHMKWFGDEYALEKRVFEKFKNGKTK